MQVIYWIIFCAIYSFANPYLSSKGISTSFIGIFLALATLLSIFFQILSTKLIDTYDKINVRNILISSVLITFLTSILMYFSENKILLLMFFSISIAGLLNSQTYMSAFIFEYINKGKDINFGLARGCGSLAFAFSSFIYGKISLKYGYSYIPLISVLLSLFIILIVMSFENIEENNTENIEDIKTGILEFFIKYKKFSMFMLGIAFLLFTHNAIATFMKDIVLSLEGGNSEVLGIGLMIAATLELPVMYGITYLNRKLGYIKIIRICAIFFSLKCILTFLAIMMASVDVFYMAQITQIGAYAVYLPATVYYTNAIMNKEDKVKGQAYIASAAMVGSILGNTLGGVIIDIYSVSMLILVCIILALFGSLIVWFNLEKV